ncbi:Rps10ap [Saccharomyces cerevisiae x Saccharomyces kudriavzevii VIN7]|uniref:Rps10ap n=1 Tax=Saccharomyces cerevisiae x Saccharomyces kudriavzevii (strain VIN7) TaxID=1095631 RepID=H0GZP0_SACCK|nr:Rps10ap [Saccharomyces cerevisiae x Saccharomyces kudriavzevii VIN7]
MLLNHSLITTFERYSQDSLCPQETLANNETITTERIILLTSRIIEFTIIFTSEGVVVAKKDFNQAKHEEIDTRNLYVIKALQSLTSKGYVKTQFSWQYYYYTLTEEGVEYLREYLNLPEHIVPGTYIQERNPTQRPQRRY